MPLQLLWPSVDQLLGEVLLYSYTDEVREAWQRVFSFLTGMLYGGMTLNTYTDAKPAAARAAAKQ